jgi:hypothetical protein
VVRILLGVPEIEGLHSGSKRTALNRRGLLSINEQNPVFKRDMTGIEKKRPLGAENDRKNRFW